MTSTLSVMYVVHPSLNGKVLSSHAISRPETVGLPCTIRMGVIEWGAVAFGGPFGLMVIFGLEEGIRTIWKVGRETCDIRYLKLISREKRPKLV